MQDNTKSVDQIVREIIRDHSTVMEEDLPGLESTLDDLALDSLDIVSVEMAIDEAVGGFELNACQFWQRPQPEACTVGQLIELVETQIKTRA